MNKEEKAVDLFDNDHNCAQSVYLACRDETLMPPETAAYVSGILGGGVGIGQTCGALCGAILALSERFSPPNLEDKDQRSSASIMKKSFAKWFQDAYGSCMCSDLRSVVPLGESSHPLCTDFVAGCAKKFSQIEELCKCEIIKEDSLDSIKNATPWQKTLCLPSGMKRSEENCIGQNETILFGLYSLGYLVATIELTSFDDESMSICSIELDIDYHKRGADRLLVACAEKHALESGYKKMNIDVDECKYTQDLFNGLGYTETESSQAEGGLRRKMEKSL